MATVSAAVETSDGLADEFRRAMRTLASGVALVTSMHKDRPCGIAMTAFMSLSLEPPAMAIAVNQSSSLHGPLLLSGRFCVNILSAHQLAMCQEFVKKGPGDRFDPDHWQELASGEAALREAMSTIVCKIAGTQSFGTHTIAIGEVQDVMLGGRIDPLIFVDGQYGSFAAA